MAGFFGSSPAALVALSFDPKPVPTQLQTQSRNPTRNRILLDKLPSPDLSLIAFLTAPSRFHFRPPSSSSSASSSPPLYLSPSYLRHLPSHIHYILTQLISLRHPSLLSLISSFSSSSPLSSSSSLSKSSFSSFESSIYSLCTSLALAPLYDLVFTDYTTETASELSRNEKIDKQLTGISLVYGEVGLETFVRIICKNVSLKLPSSSSSATNQTKNKKPVSLPSLPFPLYTGSSSSSSGVFIDIGSGTGRGVIAALLTHSFSSYIGIEILSGLHFASLQTLQTYREVTSDSSSSVELLCSDFRSIDWSSATFVFCNSTCFDRELMYDLGVKCEELQLGSVVVTLTKKLNSPLYRIVSEEDYEFSWGSATVYVHMKMEVGRGGERGGGGEAGMGEGEGADGGKEEERQREVEEKRKERARWLEVEREGEVGAMKRNGIILSEWEKRGGGEGLTEEEEEKMMKEMEEEVDERLRKENERNSSISSTGSTNSSCVNGAGVDSHSGWSTLSEAEWFGLQDRDWNASDFIKSKKKGK